MVVPQASLIEVAATRRVRVLGSLENVAVWTLTVNAGVDLGLAVCALTIRRPRRAEAKSRKTPGGKRVGWVVHWFVAVAALVRACSWRSLDL